VVVGLDERDERAGSKRGGVGEAVVPMGEGYGGGERDMRGSVGCEGSVPF